VLATVLDTCLRLLHPFMPFLTEAIWQMLAQRLAWAEADALVVAPWPKAQRKWTDLEAEEEFEAATLEVVPRVREALHALSAQAVKSASVSVAPDPKLQPDDRERMKATLVEAGAVNTAMTRTASWTVEEDIDPGRQGVFGTTGRVRFFVPADLKDIATQRARLSKQMAEAEAETRRLEAKLGNAAFREKAPATVVAKEGEKLAAARARLEGLRQRLEELG
jgi:valyl-tRNA synthetase